MPPRRRSPRCCMMLVGRWAQVAAVERNRRRLLSHQPLMQRLELAAGGSVAPEEVVAGQRVRLAPGQTLPVEARLEAGEATVSLASINGEAEPRAFQAGQRVPAGAVNLGRNPAEFITVQAWADSLLAKLLEAPERPGERHVLLERIVRGYLVGILAVALGAGLAWWFATGDALRTWSVVTAVLVVSCPCAIALAFPLTEEIATVALRRRGVFVREADLWPRLGGIRTLVFDKTGTLTLETPVLQNPAVLAGLTEAERSALLALVRDNPHPVSQCLLENLLAGGARDDPPAGELRETPGAGVELGPWTLGRAGWRDGADGAGTVFARDGRALARFHFLDTARPDARTELAALAARGFATHILSGDRAEKVAQLTRELGLPAAAGHGDLSPQDKADWLERHDPEATLMLGDGANDSLAFDRARCRGTPVIHRGVLERKADFYYLGRGIAGIRALFEVNAVRRRTQVAVLVFSIAYNLLAVGLAVAGRMNPLVAAALMPINSLLTLAIVGGGMRRAQRTAD